MRRVTYHLFNVQAGVRLYDDNMAVCINVWCCHLNTSGMFVKSAREIPHVDSRQSASHYRGAVCYLSY